jgi:hypothetical protein
MLILEGLGYLLEGRIGDKTTEQEAYNSEWYAEELEVNYWKIYFIHFAM